MNADRYIIYIILLLQNIKSEYEANVSILFYQLPLSSLPCGHCGPAE